MILETSGQTGSGQTLGTAVRLRTDVTEFEQEKHSAVGSKSVRQRIMTIGLVFPFRCVYGCGYTFE